MEICAGSERKVRCMYCDEDIKNYPVVEVRLPYVWYLVDNVIKNSKIASIGRKTVVMNLPICSRACLEKHSNFDFEANK